MFDKTTKIIGFIASIFVIGLGIFYLIDTFSYGYDDYYEFYDSDCNVGVVKLYGDLYSYIPNSDIDEYGYNLYDEVSSEQVIEGIQSFANNDQFDMILLQIDSFGGSPYAAKEIMNELKNTEKETVALIREIGDSAAYWSSLGADKIIASEVSEVGSIGVIQSFVNEEESNKMNGIKYEDLMTGKFKNAGAPHKSLTDEEKDLFMRDINITFEEFINDVANERNLRLDKVKELADGSVMLGKQALKEGLIDELGDLNTVKKEFKEKYGYEAVLCEY